MKTLSSASDLLNSFDVNEFRIFTISSDMLTRISDVTRKTKDYLLFIFANSGKAKISCDFKQYEIHSDQAMIVSPNQTLSVESCSDDAEGWIIKFPEKAVTDIGRGSLSHLLIDSSPIDPTQAQLLELKRLHDMLDTRSHTDLKDGSGDVVRVMAYTFGVIMLEALVDRTHRVHPDKIAALPLLTQLHKLFESNLTISRLPSHYAYLMDITPSYLNEKFRKLTGGIVSLYIRKESILRASRDIATSNRPIKDIALTHGYEDPAYFTRLFTKIMGMSPSAFRKRFNSSENA